MMVDYIHSFAAVPGEEILSAIAEDWWKKVLLRHYLYLLHGMLGK
jgi:hypothetical protein